MRYEKTTSDKYSTVQTADIINELTLNGYEVTDFQWARVKSQDKQGFQKHIMRLSHPDLDFKIGGLRPELIITNSYDGSASFRVMLGIYRFACANGLVLGDTFNSVKVRHVGNNTATDVLTALETTAAQFKGLESMVNRYSNKHLNLGQIDTLSQTVAKYITPDGANIGLSTLWLARRGPDTGTDLFTVLNVIQENALNGGMAYRVETEKGLKIRKTRKVKSIDRQVAINRLIFNQAEFLAA